MCGACGRCERRMYNKSQVEEGNNMSFSIWLHTYVMKMQETECHVDPTLLCLTRLLSRVAIFLKRMTTYGAHYKEDLEEDIPHHATYDSRIARIVALTTTLNIEQLGSIGILERVNILKEIIVVSFYTMKVALIRVS